MRFRIAHLEGSKKGASEQLDVPVLTVGRDPSNTLVFDPIKDDRVSTRHAQIVEQGGVVTLTDLQSRNGTFVNGARVQGQVTLAPGALIQFGDSGPMISLQWDPPAAAPPRTAASMPVPTVAPAPPKKSGGKGCVLLAVAVLVGLPCLGGIGYLVYTYKDELRGVKLPPGVPPVPGMPALPSIPPVPGLPPVALPPLPKLPPEPKPEPKKETWESPWKKVEVGTSFESVTETHMTKPMVMDTKMAMTMTLIARDEENARVKSEVAVGGNAMPASESAIPLKGEAPKSDEKPETRDESITVPAGTFACKVTKIVTKTGDVTTTSETWMNPDVPLPIKSVTTSDGMTSTATLVKIKKP